MKAAWDWHLRRKTEVEQREAVEFASACGFDTLVVSGPTEVMVGRGRELGVRLVAVVSPNATEAFQKAHPTCLQRMLPVEEAIATAVQSQAPMDYQHLSHRWFSLVQPGRLLCYEHPESRDELARRVGEALALADGVAFDGFGFQNHYACFCDRCVEAQRAMVEETDGEAEAGAVARLSENSLIGISHALHASAKSAKSNAIVMNHIWPPFNPNPYYGCRLRLDFCTQTISWFYRPAWSLERVAFEAAEMKRLEDPGTNVFVPFIGVYGDPPLVRSPQRLSRELEIAAGCGHVAFCTLDAPKRHPEVFQVLRSALEKMG